MQKKSLVLILALTSLPGLSQSATLAQPESRNFYRAPSSFAGKTVVLPIGTTFEGRIQSTIGSRQSRSGDSFSVEVSAPVLANGTEVLIPSGSEIIGEVAEAISSSSQPHDKRQYAPMGILRVQITSLRLPDGHTYPLIASFAPDGARGRRGGQNIAARKSSVAYVGTQAGFDAVNPALQPRNPRQGNGKLQVLRKGEMMSDPVLGDSGNTQANAGGQIRALVRRGRELYILSGSSMTIRLDGPLKISMGASDAQSSMQSAVSDEPAPSSTGKHFSKSRPAAAQGSQKGNPQGNPQNAQQDGGNMTAQGQQQQALDQQQQPAASTQPVRQPAPGQQPGSEF